MKAFPKLTALVLCTLFVGCNNLSTSAQPLTPEARAILDDIGRVHFHDAEMAAGELAPGDLEAAKDRRQRFYRELMTAVIHADGFAQARHRVEALLVDDLYAADPVLRQGASAALLKGHVIPERAHLNADDADDIERTAVMLMESGSPEVYTLLHTLDALEREEFTDVRQRLLDRVPAYVDAHSEHFVGCRSCVPPEVQLGPFDDVPEAYAPAVATARLRDLAVATE